jgi:hypothetical protein
MLKTCCGCFRNFPPVELSHGRCLSCAREKERQRSAVRRARRGTTAARGYGREHDARRAALLPLAIGKLCPLCGKLMRPDQPLDLDHSVPLAVDKDSKGDRIVHATCNRARRGGGRPPLETPSRTTSPPTSREKNVAGLRRENDDPQVA